MDLCIYVKELSRKCLEIYPFNTPTISSTKIAGGLREIWVFTVVTIEISDEWTYVSMSKDLSRKCLEIYEPRHESSNNVACATSKGSDQPAHMRSLIRAFASRLSIL